MISMQNTNYPAYVFATVNHGMTKNVVEELKNNPNIDLIAPVTGRFDLALRLKQNTPEQIVQLVDRKSTRLNSSHGSISYAVFCLKKKKTHIKNIIIIEQDTVIQMR